ncbi:MULTISPECIES: DUF4097 family beta strand repeat-containing protein [unclassified Kitasatospora]|uniref:DUF4097 family beta strand repeat-containing protein n=1 Tax=unclassified Kitasatospora TaxID=2633591 RepID=UPI002E3725C6|nr:DUF4097 family beta strand repeat-containing protein [Kitasatospora sp. NBC_01246]
MPSFDTPGPISATIEFDIASVRIAAGKRTDTVVEVRPADPAVEADVKAAEQTRISYAGGALVVKGPKKRSLFGRAGSVDVTVELPAGSEVHGNAPMGDFLCEGLLGDCRVRTSVGRIQVEHADSVHLRTDHGDVRLRRADGDAEVNGSGRVEIGTVAGTVTVKNLNGETVIGEAGGDLKVNSSNGQIQVGAALGDVDIKTAQGAIRIGEVVRGRVVLQSAIGELEVGIREGTAAWLDVHTKLGSLRNSLGAAAGPGEATERVEIRGRTQLGDIVIRRS